MSFVNPTIPNLADFITFCQNQGVTVTILPTSSDYYQWSLTYAEDIALYITEIPSILYVLAVYNLGMHRLVSITPDQAGQTFFTDQRASYKLLSLTPGVIESSADQSTSNSFAVPDGLKNLTLSALDMIKTPWGRYYIGYAQQYGPNVVGVS
ncbi:MAG: hypothetical protein KGI54_18680 [Pseudomonadota bacterium]|nr:hypothetical protein [Pseudomonadota bacterium]